MGITAAVIKAALILPKKKNKITITNKAPSNKLVCTGLYTLLIRGE
jgi:hypothetical protein